MYSLKTPLRYPGGKSRATGKLDKFLTTEGISEFRETFLGGGSVSLYLTQKYPDLDIWVNDLYEPLYNFWIQLQKDGDKLSRSLETIKKKNDNRDSARILFNECKENINDTSRSPFRRAVMFYIINKCSFSGLGESSSFSPQASESNFTLRGISKLPAYSKLIKNWKITNDCYSTMLDGNERTLLYLDPPYDIKDKLYGKNGSMHGGFNHDKFAGDLNVTKCKSVISYNTSNIVKGRFSGDWNASEFDLTYTMRSTGAYMDAQKERKELVLINFEVHPYNL